MPALEIVLIVAVRGFHGGHFKRPAATGTGDLGGIGAGWGFH
ncbi:MAG: hypothetical protein AB7V04_00510 [Desulfomonilaceae bacterium]